MKENIKRRDDCPLTSRRRFLGHTAALAAVAIGAGRAGRLLGGEDDVAGVHATRDLKVGDRLNESVVFPDPVTGRPTRQLTAHRQLNYQPTYHINQCFSADSRYLPIGSSDKHGSCVFWADIETGDLTVLAVNAEPDEERYSGNLTAMVDGGRLVAVATRKTMRLIDTTSLEARVVIDQTATPLLLGAPAGSIDGRTVYVPANEEVRDVGRPADPGHRVTANMANHRILAVDTTTGTVSEVFSDPQYSNNSVTPSPVDPDLLLIDRDDPGVFVALMMQAKDAHYSAAREIWSRSSLRSRTWVLNLRTGALTEILPRDPFSFAVHSCWSADGRHIYHHGWAADGGHWIGVVAVTGEVVFERVYPRFHYGHVGTHQLEELILIDGLISPDLLIGMHWRELDSTGAPRLEILGCHESDYSVPQASHPHPHGSPDGRWVSYNRGNEGRADVRVTRVA